MGRVITDLLNEFSFSAFTFLFKQSIYIILLFSIILTVTLFLKTTSPYWRYGLWLLIFIRLILPVDFYMPFSIRNILEQLPKFSMASETLVSVTENITLNQNYISNNILYDILSDQYNNSEEKIYPAQETGNSVSLYVIITSVWFAGFLLMLLLFCLKCLKCRAINRNSSIIDNVKLADIVHNWKRALMIKRNVKIITSDEFLSPFSSGIFKPLIYIPKALILADDFDTIHSIIAHEMIHIKHYDYLWMRIQSILQVVYFFHPLVWLSNRRVYLAREEICDSSVLTSGIIPPRLYGDSLIKVLKANLYGYNFADIQPGFGSQKKIYKQRLHRIINENFRKKKNIILIAAFICLIGMILLPLGNGNKNKDLNDADSVIDKYYNALGGKSLLYKHYNSVSELEIKQPIYNTTETNIRYSERPNKFLSIISSEKYPDAKYGTDGRTVWEIVPCNRKQVISKIIKGQERADRLAGYTFNVTDSWEKVDFAGTERINGMPCYKIIATQASGNKISYYISKDNYLMVKSTAEYQNDSYKYSAIPALVDTYYDDYKKVDGILIAHTIRKYVYNQLVSEQVVKKIKFNEYLPSDIFALPQEIISLL